MDDDAILWTALAAVSALVFAIGIGANDVANAFGASVGSGVLTLQQALILGTVFETLGALLLGAETSKTISTDLVMISQYNKSESHLMAGEVSALVGGSIWIHFCTFLRLPVSGTHTIVGATLGFTIFSRGIKSVNLMSVVYLTIFWLLAPVLCAFISAGLFLVIRYFVLDVKDPLLPGLRAMPLFYMGAIFLNLLSIHFVENSPIEKLLGSNFPLFARAIFSCLVALLVAVIVRWVFVPITRKKIEKWQEMQPAETYRERMRRKENVNDNLKFYFNLNMWPTHSNSSLQKRVNLKKRRLNYKAILPDNTQVYGAATLSVTSLREELGNSNMSIDSDSIVTHASVDNDEPLTGVQFSKTMKFMPSLFRSKKKDDSFTRLSSKGRRSRSKKATFQQQDECSPGYNEPDQGESHFSFDPNVVDPKQKKRRAVTDEREMKNIRIKKRLRLDSYHKNHNLRSQVINLNKKSGGILKRCVPSQFGVKMRAYSCPENLFNYSDDTPKAAAPITGGTNHIPSDTAADYIHCESLITSSNSTANHVWFSNPEIEQEEEYAKRQSIKQSLNVLSTLRYEEDSKAMGKRILFAEPTPAEMELFRNEINKRDKPECALIFKNLQILTACFAAFAHGGNDVSNAVGPLAILFMLLTNSDNWEHEMTNHWGSMTSDWKVSFAITNSLSLFGGLGISLGLWIWGYRVIKTLGEDLTSIVPSSGFTIEIGTALTVLLASIFGIPVSTTHCKVAAIVGVGYVRTKKNVDKRILKRIAAAWLVTIPAAAILSAVSMSVLREFA